MKNKKLTAKELNYLMSLVKLHREDKVEGVNAKTLYKKLSAEWETHLVQDEFGFFRPEDKISEKTLDK